MKTDAYEIDSNLFFDDENKNKTDKSQQMYESIKRVMDVTGSLTALALLSPVCMVVTAYIKLFSQGPVLFKQTRLGRNGKPFEIYKFRTMRIDAEKDSGPVWAKHNDHRFIPGGGFLRKTHVDEIPQFINVLKGEMSIIGPRPERPYFVAQLKDKITDYEKRLLIKPGITGLAQVQHRADESIQDVRTKVHYDLFYIKKKSLFFDLVILLKTLEVIVHPGVKIRGKYHESGKKSQTSGINSFTVSR
jgi:lipopolysaccharide/colanic/teichoic acid biosynthesis glycosyltransferase